ncbi:MAG: adenylyl-sulfate kinase [Candidatus Omnitrophica bacterium]|nr:adenylyl-sulfate kinase [Candidatus Omnitrophota bacterium]
MTKQRQGTIILLTGVSGSGKTTLGSAIAKAIVRKSCRPVEFIDGDTARLFLDTGLGFTPQERMLITKQIAYAAFLLSKNGVHVIVANIAGSYRTRDYLRKSWRKYVQIYLDVDINDCIRNDPKGVYKKALRRKHPLLYGLDIPYDRPRNPDITVYPYKESVRESLRKIIAMLEKKRVI